jgi:hypothetical protein
MYHIINHKKIITTLSQYVTTKDIVFIIFDYMTEIYVVKLYEKIIRSDKLYYVWNYRIYKLNTYKKSLIKHYFSPTEIIIRIFNIKNRWNVTLTCDLFNKFYPNGQKTINDGILKTKKSIGEIKTIIDVLNGQKSEFFMLPADFLSDYQKSIYIILENKII